MVDKKAKHKFKHCVVFEDKVFVPLEELAGFCRAFPALRGKDLASILDKAKVNRHPSLMEVSERKPEHKSIITKIFE